jgi:glucose-1-phosphate thymidylyltransferase
VQRRQRHIIASPEEIAHTAGWITTADLARQAERLGKSEYGRSLKALVAERRLPQARNGGRP